MTEWEIIQITNRKKKEWKFIANFKFKIEWDLTNLLKTANCSNNELYAKGYFTFENLLVSAQKFCGSFNDTN